MEEVFVDIRRCTACKSCEIACTVEHSASKNLFGAVSEDPKPQKRIHVESALAYAYPVRCMHCGDAPCIAACPNGAMSRDAGSGSVVVNAERCQGCFMCAMVCSFGAISAHPTQKVAVKCDFCPDRRADGRKPACVEACPTGALQFGDEEDLAKAKRAVVAVCVAKAVNDTVEQPTDSSPLGVLRNLGGR
jgi:anaerobic carbon-monoxide dehydrogenase iron sulfur subunit